MGASLAELRAFLAVVEEGSMSGAAPRLGVSQPSLSATMRRVEKSVGAELVIG